jgi:hypothetical protein
MVAQTKERSKVGRRMEPVLLWAKSPWLYIIKDLTSTGIEAVFLLQDSISVGAITFMWYGSVHAASITSEWMLPFSWCDSEPVARTEFAQGVPMGRIRLKQD